MKQRRMIEANGNEDACKGQRGGVVIDVLDISIDFVTSS